MKKQIPLFIGLFILLFISAQSLLSPTQIFQLSTDITSTVHSVIINNGSELYTSSVLNNFTNVIRKYIIAGNNYYLKGTYQPASSLFSYFNYDYIFVINGYLIAGSKTPGYLRIWNSTSFQYIRQLHSSLYIKTIVYCNSPTNSKFIFVTNFNQTVMYFDIANLPNSISVQNAVSPSGQLLRADDVQISPSGNYLAIFNQTFTSTTVVLTNTFSEVGSLLGYSLGQKSGCWSKNQNYFFQTTLVFDPSFYSYISKIEIYNFLSIVLNNASSTLVYPSYYYTSFGKAAKTLYIERDLSLVIPAKGTDAVYLSMNSLNYPVLGRRLQGSFLSYNFPFVSPYSYEFFYDEQKCFFSVLVNSVMYYYSFYGTCLQNQYFDTNSLTCVDCQIGCAVCTYQICVICLDGYSLDNITSVCLSNIVINQTIGNANQTNGTFFTNLNQTNSTSSNITTTSTSQINSLRTFLSLLRNFYFNFILRLLNKVPGSRKVLKPFFNFFVNLDDLWLYYYHKRSYCNTTVQMFESIKTFENQKWQAVHLQDILSKLEINEQQIQQKFSYLNEISKKRDNFIKIQQKNHGYFINTMQFYFSNFILIILVYLALRITFNLTKNYFISIFFRQYSFWIFLGIIILEGNMQYFVYLITNQMQMLFSISLVHKLSNVYNLGTFFILLVFSTIFYLLIFFNYDKKHKGYFFDNVKVSRYGVGYMFGICFLRNFVLGFLHSYFDQDYVMKLMFLGVFEIIFSVIFVFILSKKQVNNQTRQWILILCTYLRLIIIFSFYLDYRLSSNFNQLQNLQALLFIIYLVIGIFSLTYELTMFMYQSKCLLNKYVLKSHIKQQQKQFIGRQQQLIKKKSTIKMTKRFSLNQKSDIQNHNSLKENNQFFFIKQLQQKISSEQLLSKIKINSNEQNGKKTRLHIKKLKNNKINTQKRTRQQKIKNQNNLIVIDKKKQQQKSQLFNQVDKQ